LLGWLRRERIWDGMGWNEIWFAFEFGLPRLAFYSCKERGRSA
jgi:hypothetical protein